MPDLPPLLSELEWRGQLYQVTDRPALEKHLAEADPGAGGRRVYCGFDPTADSLTIGNLVPIMLLRRFQQAGHTPVVVMGGGTGLIGDPSGKEAERLLLDLDAVNRHVESQRRIFEALLDFSGPNAATIVNNDDWLGKITFLEALRDIGKHFSVNQMIQRDSVKSRLEDREHGISYTEFSYMLLQAYDFLHLFRASNVTIQAAGSDQWGNIVSGADLIRRLHGHADAGAPLAFGLTAPLLVKSDGGKFGKTESGAIWLTADRTSPYAFYQFWINADDADVSNYLRIFTDLSRDEIEALEQRHAAAPHEREAQRTLAREVTRMVHGEEALTRAEAASQALFSGDVAGLDLATLREVFADVPHSDHDKTDMGSDGIPIVDLLPLTSLARSKREAREFLSSGAITLNGERVGIDDRLTPDRLLHAQVALLRRGKKSWHVTRWS